MVRAKQTFGQDDSAGFIDSCDLPVEPVQTVDLRMVDPAREPYPKVDLLSSDHSKPILAGEPFSKVDLLGESFNSKHCLTKTLTEIDTLFLRNFLESKCPNAKIMTNSTPTLFQFFSSIKSIHCLRIPTIECSTLWKKYHKYIGCLIVTTEKLFILRQNRLCSHDKNIDLNNYQLDNFEFVTELIGANSLACFGLFADESPSTAFRNAKQFAEQNLDRLKGAKLLEANCLLYSFSNLHCEMKTAEAKDDIEEKITNIFDLNSCSQDDLEFLGLPKYIQGRLISNFRPFTIPKLLKMGEKTLSNLQNLDSSYKLLIQNIDFLQEYKSNRFLLLNTCNEKSFHDSLKDILSKKFRKNVFSKRPYTIKSFTSTFPQYVQSYLTKQFSLIIEDQILDHKSFRIFDANVSPPVLRKLSKHIFPQNKKILKKLQKSLFKKGNKTTAKSFLSIHHTLQLHLLQFWSNCSLTVKYGQINVNELLDRKIKEIFGAHEKDEIDFNNASEQELTKLKGVGKKITDRILEQRPLTAEKLFFIIPNLHQYLPIWLKQYSVVIGDLELESFDLRERTIWFTAAAWTIAL